jgi:DNA-binding transcriptional regulator YiaG
MSGHMKTHPTKSAKPILCLSEQGAVYKLPASILNKYLVNDSKSKKKMQSVIERVLSISPEEAFVEINEKYTKAGALLKAIRLREGLSQKKFSKVIKVTQGDLSKMESGKRPIGKVLVKRIASKFGTKIS